MSGAVRVDPGERVGDHRGPDIGVGIRESVRESTPVVTEARDEQESTVEGHGCEVPEPVTWVLVAWPEVLEASRALVGTESGCRHCGRQGRIEEVLSTAEWRRRVGRGVAWG
jgi:hypothetical protein